MFGAVGGHFSQIFVDKKEVNSIVTFLLIFLSLYATAVSVLHADFWSPFANSPEIPVAPKEVRNGTTGDRSEIFGNGVDGQKNVLTLLLLWGFALVLGRVVSYAKLPPLLGMLLAGIIVRNLPNGLLNLQVDADWSRVITKMAVILILLRCGLNLKPAVIRSSWARFCSLGFLTTTAEAAAIFAFSSLVLDIPTAMAAAFAFVLCSTSPAVTVPSMIRLQEKKLGGEIPTILLAAATIDNIFCIAAFSVISSLAAVDSSRILLVLLGVPLQIAAAGVVGGVIGFLLRFFPRPGMSACSFLRCTLLSFVSTALFFGSKAAGYEAFGPIAVVIVCFVAAIEWKAGGGEVGKDEEAFFRLMWTLVFQPMLFVLIGLLFDFSKITWKGTAMALLVLAVGVFVRFVSVLLTTLPMELRKSRKLFISVCFFPKATIQAALTPLIASLATESTPAATVEFVLQTCVLSILLTAPLGQLIIDRLGVVLLRDKQNVSERSAEIEEKSV